jgi:hypothetical protein
VAERNSLKFDCANDLAANIGLEPSRQQFGAILSPRRAAQTAR